FAQAIDAPDLLTHPDYATIALRSKNRDALNAAIGTYMAKRTTGEWVKILNEAGVPCGPIYSIDQVFDDTQVKHLGIAQALPDGGKQLVGQPFTLSRTPSRMAARPPLVGEQTHDVLTEFGFSEQEIASLQKSKVV
ncbi:MAG: CoA transferase, partial [Candidatus Afipia apatlaquensis]|nr:CoA transferase [Candidatus Afipia apatlaquensis]